MEEEHRLVAQRKQKLNELRKNNIEPYPYKFDKKDNSRDIFDKFKKLKREEKTKDKVSLAGRIMSLRIMGKVSFGHLQDFSGRIQFYVKEDEIGKQNYKLFKKFDIGDFVGINGIIFKTKKGETSIWVKKLELLTKSLRPLPEKWHGLKNIETRYRQRYLDLLMNHDVKEIFLKRSQIINAIREFLNSKGFMEVETPLLQPLYGGANARPFKTKINAYNMDMFLSISPELYLKRLIIGGFEKVYTISKNFRNEGVDKSHNPEFSMLEFYWAYADYNDIMKITEDLVNFVAKKVNKSTKIRYQSKDIELKKPWKKLSMKNAIKKYLKINIDKFDDKKIKSYMKGNNIEYKGDFNRGLAIELIFESLVQDKLIQPVFIIDHPKESTPLCKPKRGDHHLIERLEPYVYGWEIGNGYSELNDPELQRTLLKKQSNQRLVDEENHPVDEDFIKALEYGMPPTGGMGIGVDRLAMILTDSPTIRDVIFFPFMKPEK
ncbi:MAG: lysine--tRNA ligase [Candidatus Nanoarchaeia archaeon]|jgi:lysyl-tRNA synthetase class 2|nr:lysine--tRNA ligase [Candidatus Nanoarchaeia archaeon]|tara:strand:- start:70987 stop:72456 length:1470 start_codon:yes stop_codon:yes gene_type:complete